MNPAKVIESEVQRERRFEVLPFLAETIGHTGERFYLTERGDPSLDPKRGENADENEA